MANLGARERRILEAFLGMGGGYVLDFSDRTFGEFFQSELGINIYQDKYKRASGSKANYMRGFWEIESPQVVGNLIKKLLRYQNDNFLFQKITLSEKDKQLANQCNLIADQLLIDNNSSDASTISDKTRQNIFDYLTAQNVWYAGQIEESDFLQRIFDLASVKSNDPRYPTFCGDLYQHRVMNSDWSDNWIYSDPRFNLKKCSDQIFTKFLCEMLHPLVRSDHTKRDNDLSIADLLFFFNNELKKDGWEIYEAEQMLGKFPKLDVFGGVVKETTSRPVFAARQIGIIPTKVAADKIPFDIGYIKTQIERMEKSADSDPDLTIGTAKELIETCLKTIIGADSNDDIPKLLNSAMGKMNLLPKLVSGGAKGEEQIKRILGSLSTIVLNTNELRNLYGTGHGQMSTKSSLEPRHARLAMGAAITFVNFIFETYTKQLKQ